MSTAAGPPSNPVTELVVDDAPATHAEAARLQVLLAPGGRLVVTAPRRARRLAKVLRHYFEGGPAAGHGFHSVRAPRRGEPLVAYRRGPGLAPGHFNDLGGSYGDELPAHLVEHYLGRKMQRLAAALGPETRGQLGLDVGCGLAPHTSAAARLLGTRMVGVDAAPAVLRAAWRKLAQGGGVNPQAPRAHEAPGALADDRPHLVASDTLHLPFADATFDFAYTVNMVHHLKRGEQAMALREIMRVLKPGAPLVVFEINVLNPLFRFYMRQVFPRTRGIDRGDEEFLTPRRLADAAGQRPESTRFMTFLPDFTPSWLLPVARPIERAMEFVAGPMAIHYASVLRKPR